jgi:hypothetical protein
MYEFLGFEMASNQCTERKKEMNTNDKPMTIKITRMYAENGVSHFGELELGTATLEFAPPSPPINQSARFPVQNVQFLFNQPGWTGDWHPAPARLLFFLLAGACWQEVSAGSLKPEISACWTIEEAKGIAAGCSAMSPSCSRSSNWRIPQNSNDSLVKHADYPRSYGIARDFTSDQ